MYPTQPTNTWQSHIRYHCVRDVIAQGISDENPAYCFFPQQLASTVERFRSGFPGEVSYAVKANNHPLVLQELWRLGIRSFDVASIGEIAQLRQFLPEATLHYNNPVRSEKETQQAYQDYAIRSFVVDDINGLNKLHRAAKGDVKTEVTVRFTLPHKHAAYDFGTKFGANPEEATALLGMVRDMGYIPSITFHPGSQCTDPNMYIHYIQQASTISRNAGVSISRLNTGGGFPVLYADTDALSLERFFTSIATTVQQEFATSIPLICEPGRALVAECISLLTRIKHIRDSRGEIVLNDGIYGGMQEHLLMSFQRNVNHWPDLLLGRNEKTSQHGETSQHEQADQQQDYAVFGPTCDSMDCISQSLRLPHNIEEGDWLEFSQCGAYSSVTTTEFNGFTSNQYVVISNGLE